MSGKVSYIFTLAWSTYLVHKSGGDVLWTRDEKFNDVIKVDGSSHTEERRAVSVGRCASLCTSASWCSSFFFLPTTEKCLLNELIFAKPGGGQSSPGARYYKTDSASCSSRDGFVWVRGQHTCIKVYTSRTTFHYAYRNCTSVGLQLAVLDTGDKIRAVKAYIEDQAEPILKAYIGGVRDGVVNGTRTSWNNSLHPFYWLNGVRVPTTGPDLYWCTEQPDNYEGIEGCMQLFNGQWNDVACDLSLPFICEKLLA